MKIKTLNCAMAAAALLLVACEGENLDGQLSEKEARLSEDYLAAEGAFSNIYNIVDIALRDSALEAIGTAEIDGANVKREGQTVTIDYGNGAVGRDGRTRTGAILVQETGDYFAEGGSIQTSFDSYTVDDVPVVGSFTVDNHGNDSLALAITGFSADENFTVEATRSIQWNSGFETKGDEADDAYSLRGTTSGADADQNSLTSEISEPLVFDRTCEYGFVSGNIGLSFATTDPDAEASAGAIDFLEDDGCDDVARITIQKGESEVTLTRQFDGF